MEIGGETSEVEVGEGLKGYMINAGAHGYATINVTQANFDFL